MQVIGASKFAEIGDVKTDNFHSSPKFKHKRYLTSKYEAAACSGTSVFNPNIGQELTNEEDNKAKTNVAVQPPLPLGTPPPDRPSNCILKEEVIDDVYDNNNTSKEQNNTGSEYEITTDKPKKIMCKDFVRGNCKRARCYYSHEVDVTQLEGVYTFCWDFANGKCKRSECLFVHASTPEKERFFKTGKLPPHTLSHLKDPAIAQQPRPVSEAPTQPCMPIYPSISVHPANPPHSEYNSCAPPMFTAMTVPSVAPVDPGMYNMFTQPQLLPPKHVWNQGNGINRENEELPKKCINCAMAEISYQQNKTKLEGIEKTTKKLKENIEMLDQKKALLMALLTMMWKDVPNTLEYTSI